MPRPKRVVVATATPAEVTTSTEKKSSMRSGIITANTTSNKFITRPGVEAAIRLVSYTIQHTGTSSGSNNNNNDNNDTRTTTAIASVWEQIEEYYPIMLQEKGGSKLIELDTKCDTIYRPRFQRYNKSCASSSKSSILLTQKELLDIIEWKFLKGKARPMLYKQIKSNTDSAISTAISNAIGIIDEQYNDDNDATATTTIIKESIDAICVLKGIGPATASAILSLYKPELFVFMDDEIIETLYTKGKRNYTVPIYIEINQQCRDLANQLLSAQSDNHNTTTTTTTTGNQHHHHHWTARRVGKVLWTIAKLSSSSETFNNDTKLHPITVRLLTGNDIDEEENDTDTNTKPSAKKKPRTG